MSSSPQSRFAMLRRLTPDAFTIALMLAMLAATFWPAGGAAAAAGLGHLRTCWCSLAPS